MRRRRAQRTTLQALSMNKHDSALLIRARIRLRKTFRNLLAAMKFQILKSSRRHSTFKSRAYRDVSIVLEEIDFDLLSS